jgi:hypothetical protein
MNEQWKVVPIEPTQEMKDAADKDHSYFGHVATKHYRAMLAAAPQPPVLSTLSEIRGLVEAAALDYAPDANLDRAADLLSLLSAPQTPAFSDAAWDVFAERQRQVEMEGCTPAKDDTYRQYELGNAAAAYILDACEWGAFTCEGIWPWDKSWFKTGEPRKNLVKAGALVLAEIERLDRAAAAAGREAIDG